MKIVIDIPKDYYYTIKDGFIKECSEFVTDAILNGAILPKGYGRLIDVDKLIKSIEKKSKRLKNLDTINGLCGAVALAFEAETVIEADKGEEE